MNLPQRKSIRLPHWNYSSRGYYFVTICTQNRECLFGKIVGVGRDQPVMKLNQYGKIIKNVWEILPNRFPISLDYYQIMPNHIHGIIQIIDNNCIDNKNCRGSIYRTRNQVDYIDCHAGAINCAPTLGSIIRYFKAKSTRLSRIKLWQRNYYEHIVRNEKELNQIREYLLLNPALWPRDRNNPENF